MNKYPQKSIIGKIRKDIIEKGLIQKGDKIIVALSGGPDSMCLLNVLNELKADLGFFVSVCHFNHKLRGEASDQDQQFVLNYCEKNNIKCISDTAPDKNLYKSEEKARVARYSFFQKILEEGSGDKIAIAHNQNDLSETFLMRVIRGTGISGLRSIPYAREKFIRPLLSISRTEIEDYLTKNKIPFRIDQTNFDPIYTRNKIRLQLVSYIREQLNPNITETLANMSKHVGEDYDFIEENAQEAYNSAVFSENHDSISLSAKKWLLFHPAIQRMVLRIALHKLSLLDNITAKQIDEAIQMIRKGTGKKYKILPHSLRIELENDKINILQKDI